MAGRGRAAASACRRSPAAGAAASTTAPAPARARPAASPARPRRPRGRSPARPSGCSAASARLSQPVSLGAGLAEAAFQHVLAVEMRALAIGRRRRMHDRGRAGLVEPMQVRHRRVEREEGVERQRRRLAVERERLVAAQRRSSPDRRPARPPRARRARRAARSSAGADRGPRRARASADTPRRTARRRRAAGAASRSVESRHRLTCRMIAIACQSSAVISVGIPAPSAAASAPAAGFRRARWPGASRPRRAAPSDFSTIASRIDAARPRAARAVGDVEPLREAVDPGRSRRRSPSGADGRHSGSPSRCAPAGCGACRRGVTPTARRRADDPLARPLELGARRRPRPPARSTSVFAISFRSPSVSRKRFDSRSTSARRRLVGDEMARELGRDVRRGRRMTREIGEHGAALLDPAVGIGLAEHRLRPGSCMRAIEHELAAVFRILAHAAPWSSR